MFNKGSGDLHFKLSSIVKNDLMLDQALTHKSYAKEHKCKNNQRLEFLGDAVLELAISNLIFKKFKDFDEGRMSMMRSRLVDENGLYKAAGRIGLPDLIKLGKSEIKTDGRQKKSIVADCFEAVVGAIYLAAGFDKTEKILHNIFSPLAATIASLKDPKTKLQELSQKLWKTVPEYKIISVEGPEHKPIYTVRAKIRDMSSEASGENIKTAEENAAGLLLDLIRNEI